MKKLLSKILLSIIFILSSLIFVEYGENEKLFKDKVLNNNISFSELRSYYDKYFKGDKVSNEDNNDMLVNNVMEYEYIDGRYKYLKEDVSLIQSGIVVYVGEKDNLGNTTVISSETFYIDNTAPTVGTVKLIPIVDDPNMIPEYIVDTWTKHSVTITLTDGYDGDRESGHNNTIYNITGTYKNANGEYVEYIDDRQDKTKESVVTLTETGEYEVRVTTTDNVGNFTVTPEKTYIIKIDKEAPIVGTITMTYEGTANVYNKEVLTNKSVNIALNNGSDDTNASGTIGESGHKRTTYAIYYTHNANILVIMDANLQVHIDNYRQSRIFRICDSI